MKQLLISLGIVTITVILATAIDSCTYNTMHRQQTIDTDKRLQINTSKAVLYVNLDSLTIDRSDADTIIRFQDFEELAFYIDNYTEEASR